MAYPIPPNHAHAHAHAHSPATSLMTRTMPANSRGGGDQAHLLTQTIDTLLGQSQLWMDLSGDGYITLLNTLYTGHSQWESHGLRSRSFIRHLKDLHYTLHNAALPDRQAYDVVDILDGAAAKTKDRTRAWVRSAMHEGQIYVDLANDSYELIRIAKDGWTCQNQPEPKFRRLMGMQPMVRPGAPDDGYRYLCELIPLKNEDDIRLLVGWMLMSLFPSGPYPVLVLNGRPRSGKSTLTSLLRRLLDPHQTETMGLPPQESQLVLTASQSRIIALDNLSTIPPWASDAICRICSGTGSRIKRNYHDTEEIVLRGQCAVIMNGVTNVATAPDLISRSIILDLDQIPSGSVVTEKAYWKEFDRMAPHILGWLLDALCWYLQAADTYTDAFELPRMADFAHLVCVCEQWWDWPTGSFLAAYQRNQDRAHRLVIDHNPAAVHILRLSEGGFDGDYETLLRELNTRGRYIDKQNEWWPQNTLSMSRLLEQCEDVLEASGYTIVRTRKGKYRTRWVSIQRSRTRQRGR